MPKIERINSIIRVRYQFFPNTWYFYPLGKLFSAFWSQNEPNELIIDVKKRSVAMFKTLFGVNISIYKGAMAPISEVCSHVLNFIWGHYVYL